VLYRYAHEFYFEGKKEIPSTRESCGFESEKSPEVEKRMCSLQGEEGKICHLMCFSTANIAQLKCDETKPSCQQCSRKSVACPGYKSKPLVWSTKHENMLVTESSYELPSESVALAHDLADAVSGQTIREIVEDLRSASSEEEVPIPEGTHVTNLQPSSQLPPQSSTPRTDSLSAIRQQLDRSQVPSFLLHLPTMLVEYYFTYICQIFSSFDGTLNPFRSTVGRLWDGSAPIYYAIQSMAAAYLSNDFPRMKLVGVQMQKESFKCLCQNGDSVKDKLDMMLLTVLLVGQTTSWHDPKDLGLVHLKTAKRLNRRRLERQGMEGDGREKRQNEFFEQCILYWDMLAGFVDDDVDEFGTDGSVFEMVQVGPSFLGDRPALESQSMLENPAPANDAGSKVFPHPWTGVSPKVQRLFAQVGRVIRKYQKIASDDALFMDLGFGLQHDPTAVVDVIMQAQLLEEELLAWEPPQTSSLVDAGDENTPVQQYISLAEAYRCAGLLQIYRVFPGILCKRVPTNKNSFLLSGEGNLFSDEGMRFVTTSPDSPTLLDPLSELDITTKLNLPFSLSGKSPEEFLTSIAMHTLSILETLPPTSGTRCLQPIILISAGSELRFSSSTYDPLSPFTSSTSSFGSLNSREVDIASARRFVLTRLQEMQLSLPAKPIITGLKLVKETWRRCDEGAESYWMDVAGELGLGTIFG
jgi:hypothetical protein